MDLTRQLLDLGDAMLAALHADDYDALVAAAHQRQAVVDQMQAEGIQPDPAAEGGRLQVQADALAEALTARERHLGETLGGMRQFKTAQQRYAQPPRRRSLLNKHVHG